MAKKAKQNLLMLAIVLDTPIEGLLQAAFARDPLGANVAGYVSENRATLDELIDRRDQWRSTMGIRVK